MDAPPKPRAELTHSLLLDLYETDAFARIQVEDQEETELKYIGGQGRDLDISDPSQPVEYEYQGLKNLYERAKSFKYSNNTLVNLDRTLLMYQEWQNKLFPYGVDSQAFADRCAQELKPQAAGRERWELRYAHSMGWDEYWDNVKNYGDKIA